jgi:hypothetical protein
MFEFKDKITVSKFKGMSETVFNGFFRGVILFGISDGTHEILSNGSIKDTWFLGEISDVRIVGFQGGFIEFVSEDQDVSLIRVKVSCDEFHEGGLPSSTGTNKSSLFSLLNGERKIVKDFILIVTIGDIFNDDGFIFGGEGGTGVVAFEFGRIIKHVPKFFYVSKILCKIFIKLGRIKKETLKNNEECKHPCDISC